MLIVQFNGILWQNVWASNFIKKKYEDHKCHNEVGIGFKDDNITIFQIRISEVCICVCNNKTIQ